MANNIEIKAHVADLSAVLERAIEISGSEGVQLTQHDTFFNCTSGRLKLREFPDGTGQLISYQRPDALEPTQSVYQIYATDSPGVLRDTLTMTLGLRGEVKKKRRLIMAGRTRIHIDEVEELGSFLELEVVLEPGEGQADGVKEAENIMKRLGVLESDLIRGAYVDLLSENCS